MEIRTYEDLKYWVRQPNCAVDGKPPLIIFLHGAGTRGEDMERLKNNTFFVHTKPFENFPFLSVAPLCAQDQTWFDYMPKLKGMIRSILAAGEADPKRVYLIGNSMGGYGTWQLAMSVPELFAAIVPVCGGGMYWNAGRLQNVPVWAFHGGKDPTVFVEESQKMVDAVNRKGGNAKLTIYPEHKHDSWTDTFSNRAVYDWLLTHENAAAALTDEYNNAEVYG